MIDTYITPKEFASCVNVPEKDIDKVISNLESKEKELYVDEVNNILLNQFFLSLTTAYNVRIRNINESYRSSIKGIVLNQI